MFYAFSIRKWKKPILFFLAAILAMGCCSVVLKQFYPMKHLDLIQKYSKKYGVEPSLVCAVINAESRFDSKALSNKGASGLMQLMKQTADWGAEEIGLESYSYDLIFTPEINIELGCWYLAKLINSYDGNVHTALAAYNAGSGNVAKWLSNESYSEDGKHIDNIPFGQTETYVKKVLYNQKVYRILLSNKLRNK